MPVIPFQDSLSRTRSGEPSPCPAGSEADLVARLRRGEDAAYETLVRTYGPRMLTVARRYVPRHEDAEDVLQSAFLQVVRFLPRFEGASRLSTWLHRIVVNCALMALRTRKRRPETRLNLSTIDDDRAPKRACDATPSVADQVARRETRVRLRGAVERLPDDARVAVRLCDLEGLSLAQASHLLGRASNAVHRSVHRGRSALRTLLSPGGTFAVSDAEGPGSRHRGPPRGSALPSSANTQPTRAS